MKIALLCSFVESVDKILCNSFCLLVYQIVFPPLAHRLNDCYRDRGFQMEIQ